MYFQSTRSVDTKVRLLEAVQMGLAPDGGLFIPQNMPVVNWDSLSSSSFADCSASFLYQWLSGVMSKTQIDKMIGFALNFDVPMVPLTPRPSDKAVLPTPFVTSLGQAETYVLELFHGPTLSFKDFGARTLAFLLRERLRETKASVTILVATSGDTGSAVADGLSGIEGIRVVLLYPRSQVSLVQEKQLIVKREGVLALRVDGTFDDCQCLVKGAFLDETLSAMHLSTANSINIGRLIPQMLYYVWASKQLQNSVPQFVVPSGNLGNLTAGVMAYKSGLPVTQFVAAHNANDFFPKYLKNKDAVFEPSVQTISNAMDVGAPSNFERLTSLLTQSELSRMIKGISFSNHETLQSMEKVYDETGYIADPHTAVGLAASERVGSEISRKGPTVVLSTAHPAKFPDIVKEAVGVKMAVPPQLTKLSNQPVQVFDLSPSQSELSLAILSHKWNR